MQGGPCSVKGAQPGAAGLWPGHTAYGRRSSVVGDKDRDEGRGSSSEKKIRPVANR
jgi:hypothetical protein